MKNRWTRRRDSGQSESPADHSESVTPRRFSELALSASTFVLSLCLFAARVDKETSQGFPYISFRTRKTLLIIVAFLPIVADTLIVLSYPKDMHVPTWLANVDRGTLVWLASYAILTVALIAFPGMAVKRWTDIVKDFTSFLGVNENRAIMAKWVRERNSLRLQAIQCSLTGCAGVALVALASHQLQPIVSVCIPIYVIVFIACFLGGNAVFWLWNGGFILFELCHMEGLSVRWNSPASTPTIRSLSRVLGFAALLASTGLAVTFTPAVYFYSRVGAKGSLAVADLLLLFVGASTLAVVGVLPQVWLSRLIRQEKRLSLELINAHMPKREDGLGSPEALEKVEFLMNTYNLVHQSPSTAISLEPIIEYSAAAIAATIPVIYQIRASHG